MADTNTPRRMDAAGKYLLYYESGANVHIVLVLKLLRHIPVVDNDNNIVGIIAQADLAVRVDEPEKKLVKWLRKFRKPMESEKYSIVYWIKN